MSGSGSSEDTEAELVSQVVAACQAGIARALAEPSEALSLARGLDAALTSLKLVEAEVGKGEHGARALVDNAEALTRQALTDVLRIAPDPARSLAALASVARVGQHATGGHGNLRRAHAAVEHSCWSRTPLQPAAELRAGLAGVHRHTDRD